MLKLFQQSIHDSIDVKVEDPFLVCAALCYEAMCQPRFLGTVFPTHSQHTTHSQCGVYFLWSSLLRIELTGHFPVCGHTQSLEYLSIFYCHFLEILYLKVIIIVSIEMYLWFELDERDILGAEAVIAHPLSVDLLKIYIFGHFIKISVLVVFHIYH